MGTRDFFDPPWEKTNVILIDDDTLRMAEQWIKSCEGCSPDKARMPFDWVLDRVTTCGPSVTDYVLERPARCPRCKGAVSEKTLVDLRDDDFGGDGAGSVSPGHDACTGIHCGAEPHSREVGSSVVTSPVMRQFSH